MKYKMETCLKTINLRKRMFYISPRSVLVHTWIIDERKTKKFYLYLFIKLLFLLLWSRNAKANTWSVLVSIFRNDPYNLFLWNVNDVTVCLHKKNVGMNGFWSDAKKIYFYLSNVSFVPVWYLAFLMDFTIEISATYATI